MGKHRILLLHGPEALSFGMKSQLNTVLKLYSLSIGDFQEVGVWKSVPELYVVKELWSKRLKAGEAKRKKKPEVTKDKLVLEAARQQLDYTCKQFGATFIVIADPAMLKVISGEHSSLDQCRGSIYYFNGIPAICINDPQRMMDTNEGRWVAINDFAKLKRFLDGVPRQEPKFEYTVCRSLEDVYACKEFCLRSPVLAIDSETRDDWLKCIQYTGVVEGRVHTYVIPFFNPTTKHGGHWPDHPTEVKVWQVVAEIHDNDAWKVFQNGSYDCSLFIKYRVPVRNWFADTAHLWHCLYAELPKRLDFIASICTDHYRFWKEEANLEKSSLDTATATEKLERFWRYGALDTYYTFLGVQVILNKLFSKGWEWAVANYRVEFSLQVGPAMAMQCRGLLRDNARWTQFRDEWLQKKLKALETCQAMTADSEFNPGSPQQVGDFFYNIIGAQRQKVKGKEGSTDEMTLKRFGEQHKLYEMIATAILDYREAAKILGTYIFYKQRRNRTHYSMNCAATDTSRWGSGTFLWEGTNGQTFPDHLRGMFIADKGWILFDIDLEQSDARFMAYESEDPKYIENVESGKDTHCLHAAHFFKEPYEVIVDKVKAGIPRYADKQTGVRATTKKIVHGTNYLMREGTLYLTMVKDLGRKAVIIAIETAFGVKNAHTLPQKSVLYYLKQIQESYHELYKGLRPFYAWVKKQIKETGRTTTAFGWTRIIFGNPEDDGTLRAAVAGYGQGDTAGCVNRAVGLAYYGGEYNGRVYAPLEGSDFRFLLQCHDSLMGMVRPSAMHKLVELAELLELPVRIRQRDMRVPASIAIGVRWGDKNLKKPTRQQLLDGTWRELFNADK